jgi:hypothetical protein
VGGHITFAGYCPGEHKGPISVHLTPDQARDILKMETPGRRCSCGETMAFSPEALDGIRRQLEALSGGAAA